jgi:hypothetical protein
MSTLRFIPHTVLSTHVQFNTAAVCEYVKNFLGASEVGHYRCDTSKPIGWDHGHNVNHIWVKGAIDFDKLKELLSVSAQRPTYVDPVEDAAPTKERVCTPRIELDQSCFDAWSDEF